MKWPSHKANDPLNSPPVGSCFTPGCGAQSPTHNLSHHSLGGHGHRLHAGGRGACRCDAAAVNADHLVGVMGEPWLMCALPECRRGVQEPEPAGLVDGMSADDMMPSAAQVHAAAGQRDTHPKEPHTGGTAGRLNRLRAAVLGANDGIVSVAGIVIGVAGATSDRGPIFTAGLAGLVAGAVSMALGEYVSVSS